MVEVVLLLLPLPLQLLLRYMVRYLLPCGAYVLMSCTVCMLV
jgi:hypothetical protein